MAQHLIITGIICSMRAFCMVSCLMQHVAADFVTVSPLAIFVNFDFSMLRCKFSHVKILSIRFLNVHGSNLFSF